MDHDERCTAQDLQLGLLKQQFAQSDATQHEIVARVQQLVTEMHDQRVISARVEQKVDSVKEQVGVVEGKVDEIESSLKNDYAARRDLDELKRQWHVFLGLILAGVLATAGAAIVYFLQHGGGK